MNHTPTEAEEWEWRGCLECVFTSNGPNSDTYPRNNRCPNDGSLLLRMPALTCASNVIEVARAIVDYSQRRSEIRLTEISAAHALRDAQTAIERLAS